MGFAQDVKDFVSSITSGQGQNYNTSRDTRRGSQPGGPDVRAPRGMTRPKMRPGSTSTGNSSDGGDGKTAKERAEAKSFADLSRRQQQYLDANPIEPPKASELIFDNVPYFSGPNIRPRNMVFKDGVYVPDPTNKPGLADFMRTRKEMPKSLATDLRLGLGSLSGPEGFADALEGLGFGTFRNDDGSPSAEALGAYANFQDASRNSRDRQEAESEGDGDDNFYGNYDPCPEGYRTDPVTGMCVPVMGMSYETAPAAPAQYQGNFVDSPFPDLAPRGPALPMGGLPMSGYTQAMNYTSPNIAPSSMAAQGMGIAGIPMTPILG